MRPLLLPTLVALVAIGVPFSAAAAEEAASGPREISVDLAGSPERTKAAQAPGSGFILPGHLVLHPAVALELGYDSNIFYQESETAGTGVFRITSGVQASNRTGKGERQKLDLTGGANVTLRQNISDSPDARARMISGQLSVQSSVRTIGETKLEFSESFARSQDAGYTPASDQITRNENNATLGLSFSPPGARLSASAAYVHALSVYDGDLAGINNSQTHSFAVRGRWQALPRTNVAGEISQGFVRYFDDSNAHNPSNPVSAAGSLSGGLTFRSSFLLRVGWYKGFYKRIQRDPTGFTAEARVTYRLTPTVNATLTYQRGFIDSVWASFRTENNGTLTLQQALTRKLAYTITGTYTHRSFGENPPATYKEIYLADHRVDHFMSAQARFEIRVRPWIRAMAQARVVANVSDFAVLTLDGAQYTKHSVDYTKIEALTGLMAEY